MNIRAWWSSNVYRNWWLLATALMATGGYFAARDHGIPVLTWVLIVGMGLVGLGLDTKDVRELLRSVGAVLMLIAIVGMSV